MSEPSQDELMAKEEARIKAKREANEQRRIRYLNAKVRLIGLDVQALDQQVLEKQQRKSQERDYDKFESKFPIYYSLKEERMRHSQTLLLSYRNPSHGNRTHPCPSYGRREANEGIPNEFD